VYDSRLRGLARHVNLDNLEAVKAFIASERCVCKRDSLKDEAEGKRCAGLYLENEESGEVQRTCEKVVWREESQS